MPMAPFPEPAPANDYLAPHVDLLCRSYRHRLGRELLPAPRSNEAADPAAIATALYHAPFVVVSHGTEADPIFNYGNRLALELFAMSWAEFTALPSRHSAEAPNREERARLLAAVSEQGVIADYRGVRITRDGRRFWIEAATVWNLCDAAGQYRGQAASFSQWRWL